jgi:carboxypeptidase Taq
LKENVQRYGGLYKPREVIEKATGAAPSEAPLLSYVEAKFGALYNL